MILDLTDHILAISVRMLAMDGLLWDLHPVSSKSKTGPHSLVTLLHVLPRPLIPTATKTALAQLPSVSFATAAKVGDSWLLSHLLATTRAPACRHAMDLASEQGQVAALHWLYSHRFHLWLSWTAGAVDKASANGHVHVLQWWVDHCGALGEVKYSDAAMHLAARHGHLHVLEWWLGTAHLRYGLALKCPQILAHAAEGGHVEVLDWCVQHLLPLTTTTTTTRNTNALLVRAIENGHNHVLHWWDANRAVVSNSTWLSQDMQAMSLAAASEGNLIALQCLASKCWYVGNQHDALSAAIVAGNLDTVQWIHAHPPAPAIPAPLTKPGGRQRGGGYGRSSSISTPWRAAGATGSAVTSSNEPYYLATKHGHAHLLPWLATCTGYKPHAKTNYKTIASAHGHLDVLQWWWTTHDLDAATKPVPRRFEPMALIRATDAGHTHILQWWKSTGLLHPTSASALLGSGLLDAACAAGHVAVVDWWMTRSGVAVEYDKHVMDEAAAHGRVHVLEWWVQSGYPLKYSQEALDGACAAGHVHVVRWWMEQARLGRVEVRYTQRAITGLARARPDVAALVWKRYGLALMGVSSLTHWGDLQFLDVWRDELGVSVQVHSMAMDWHSGEGDVAKLEYLVQNHEPKSLVYTQAAMGRATAAGHMHVLEWWLSKWKCGKISKLCVPADVLSVCKSAVVEQWWLESGLL
ncbi:hypothetical protein BCR44DRAFT_323497 [Catenaria anguillulae PL171]|uniref:Ankyrin repeat-containing domain protein n=1 Tax=Catenaria anguillulae PL171 TaxID=765915 RepID=A0A1Y2HT92_9FUNG|nr:hypothetical protein BCR44DRAFT_323497 [Catenaria anguillulae PL171]